MISVDFDLDDILPAEVNTARTGPFDPENGGFEHMPFVQAPTRTTSQSSVAAVALGTPQSPPHTPPNTPSSGSQPALVPISATGQQTKVVVD